MTLQILLPADFREEHRQIVLAYLLRGHEFTRDEWRRAVIAFDMLKNAVVVLPSVMMPFPLIYRQYVEDSYANSLRTIYLSEKSASRHMILRYWASRETSRTRSTF
jgi:hypothetical protein